MLSDALVAGFVLATGGKRQPGQIKGADSREKRAK